MPLCPAGPMSPLTPGGPGGPGIYVAADVDSIPARSVSVARPGSPFSP